jgi:hypothetical protein
MKRQLFIHIGPFKTGTTSVQEHFWNNRSAYMAEGLLYPKTAITADEWGHRHLHLAKVFRPKVWGRLVNEIEAAPCPKVLVSAERLSTSLSHLAQARPLIDRYDPHLIVVLRDEVDLVRSMYLQIVKGYFTYAEERHDGRIGFAEWWHKARPRYVYGRMVQQWADVFGPDRMTFLVYPKGRRFDVVEEMCRTLDVPVLKRRADNNPSIGAFAARSAIFASRFGWETGRRVMELARRLERRFPKLAKSRLPGFDPEELRTYYALHNRKPLETFPAFAAKYAELNGQNR